MVILSDCKRGAMHRLFAACLRAKLGMTKHSKGEEKERQNMDGDKKDKNSREIKTAEKESASTHRRRRRRLLEYAISAEALRHLIQKYNTERSPEVRKEIWLDKIGSPFWIPSRTPFARLTNSYLPKELRMLKNKHKGEKMASTTAGPKLPRYDHEGCLVFGAIIADKVPGTLLFSPSADSKQDLSFEKDGIDPLYS